ncbi:UNVERIFIED_CONTAM: hypothetical protein FKN15_052885 [Acipenser sinensis]
MDYATLSALLEQLDSRREVEERRREERYTALIERVKQDPQRPQAKQDPQRPQAKQDRQQRQAATLGAAPGNAEQQAAPGDVEQQAAPGDAEQQAAPGGAGDDKLVSPGNGELASPGDGELASPGDGELASPGDGLREVTAAAAADPGESMAAADPWEATAGRETGPVAVLVLALFSAAATWRFSPLLCSAAYARAAADCQHPVPVHPVLKGEAAPSLGRWWRQRQLMLLFSRRRQQGLFPFWLRRQQGLLPFWLRRQQGLLPFWL